MVGKANVLFLCPENAARSQIAEGILGLVGGDTFYAFSAGANPHPEVSPLAVKAMRTIGFEEFRGHKPRSYESLDPITHFEYVFSLSEDPVDICGGVTADTVKVQWRMPDPFAYPQNGSKKEDFFVQIADSLYLRILLFVELYEDPSWGILSKHQKKIF